MEIAPNVHAVQLRGASGFLLTEDRLTLIDAGLVGSRPVLERYLSTIAREISELDRVVCTHGHPDHVGGAREIADAAGAEIYIHPTDLEGVGLTVREALAKPPGESLRGRLLQAMTPHPGTAVALNDGDVLPVLGGLEVVHTPGHTPGSVCLFARGPRILFTGDVLQVRRGKLAFASPIFSHDHAQARASVRRLVELHVDMIVFSHFRPMRDGASDALADLASQAAART
ncbi:MAG: MBL fold metallo-hydrolase [Chloroflexi bacterium]|nr:MAG: MBL fold metallo-hydrolase [Chloroflexota bacterium]